MLAYGVLDIKDAWGYRDDQTWTHIRSVEHNWMQEVHKNIRVLQLELAT